MSKNGPETTPKFCGNCGQKLLGGATFCAYCGTPVPTIESTGVVSAKPSSPYAPIPPTVSSRGAPTYPPSYRPERIVREPALPFAQHFQGVLLSPQLEMPRIVKRANLSQPFLIVLIAGIISGIALFILTSKTTIEFSSGLFESLGMSGADIDMEEYMQFFMMMTAFFTPFGFLISWIIGSIVLWILQAIFSSQVPSHERNFKTMATIVGWSFLPRIFNELVRLAAFIFLIEPSIVTIDDIWDLSAISAPLGIIGDILSFVDIIFLIWGVVLVYFAVKSIDPEGSHAVIIGIIYAVILFFVF
ncbi:MAG: YIP1 family protein [Candidatus Heimdallarchaeota archaeon]|nr:MAG: YIP1 family protein [Candidatus Heimdallarchaeota archaeon]